MRKPYCFFILSLLAGCGPSGTVGNVQDVLLDEQQFRAEIRLQGIETGLAINRPCDVHYHPGGFLILSDTQDGMLLKIIEIASGREQLLLNRGRASQEALSVKDIAVTEDNGLFVSSPQDRKLIHYRLAADRQSFVLSGIVESEAQFLRAMPCLQGGYVLEASSSSGCRLLLADSAGAVTDTLGSFPAIPGNSVANNALFQSTLAVGPDGKTMATAYASLDYIDIYDGMHLRARLSGPERAIPEVQVRSTPIGEAYSFSPVRNAYAGTSITTDGIWVGRIGVTISDEADYLRGISSIYRFALDGEPQRKYELDRELVSFDVDEAGGRIYGVTAEAEARILCFEL